MPTAKYQGKELKEGEEVVVKISFSKESPKETPIAPSMPAVTKPIEQPVVSERLPEPQEILQPQTQKEVIESIQEPEYIDVSDFSVKPPAVTPEVIAPVIPKVPVPPEMIPESEKPTVYSANDFLAKASSVDKGLISTEKAQMPGEQPIRENPVIPVPAEMPVVDSSEASVLPAEPAEEVILPEAPESQNNEADIPEPAQTPHLEESLKTTLTDASRTNSNKLVMGCLLGLFLSFLVLLIIAGVMLFKLL